MERNEKRTKFETLLRSHKTRLLPSFPFLPSSSLLFSPSRSRPLLSAQTSRGGRRTPLLSETRKMASPEALSELRAMQAQPDNKVREEKRKKIPPFAFHSSGPFAPFLHF